LLIAFHFPPILGSSGVHRTLNFCRYLPDNGWEPLLLTVKPFVYEKTSEAQLADVPPRLVVRRAWALDSARHLSIKGRYFDFTANPDRYASWRWSAIPAGLALVKRFEPQVVWCTYPIATTLQIGRRIAMAAHLPLVVDFRDLMVDNDYPPSIVIRRRYERIERESVVSAARVVLTTPASREICTQRYPNVPASHWACIYNGYNEDDFKHWLPAQQPPARPNGCLQLLHSGLLDPVDRDPVPFFDAIAALRRAGVVSAKSLRVSLRATAHDDKYQPVLAARGIEDIVKLLPATDYPSALREMAQADGLLVFQGRTCNHLIPAKLYEYLRVGRPILALTERHGESGRMLLAAGVDSLVRMESAAEIQVTLPRFLEQIRNGTAPRAPAEFVIRYSRQSQTRDLANLFADVSTSGRRAAR